MSSSQEIAEALTQFITSPKFIQSDDSSKNTLDYIMSDNCKRVANLGTGAPLENAKQAHVTLCWDFLFACEPSKRFSYSKYNLNKGGYDSIVGEPQPNGLVISSNGYLKTHKQATNTSSQHIMIYATNLSLRKRTCLTLRKTPHGSHLIFALYPD